MGFGFIEFDSVETATSVCKDLQVKTKFVICAMEIYFVNCEVLFIVFFSLSPSGNHFGWACSYLATLSDQEG